MPNHVTHVVRVRGPKAELRAFASAHVRADANTACRLDFNTIVPQPDGLSENWRAWRCEHWGTKWNSYDFLWRRGPDDLVHLPGLTLQFDTAWSPPIPIFKKLVELWPALAFHVSCFDEGWGFCGEGWFGANLGGAFASFKVSYNDLRSRRLHELCYGEPMESA